MTKLNRFIFCDEIVTLKVTSEQVVTGLRVGDISLEDDSWFLHFYSIKNEEGESTTTKAVKSY
jgi:hypothetical protein